MPEESFAINDTMEKESAASADAAFVAGFDEVDQKVTESAWPVAEDDRMNAEPEKDTTRSEDGEEKEVTAAEDEKASAESGDAAGFDEEEQGNPNNKPLSAEAAQEKPLKVFFMGKETEIPAQDVPELVQKGLNHDRMETKLKQMEDDNRCIDALHGIAAYYSLSPDELIQHTIDNYQNLELNRLKANGMPEGQALELFYHRLADARANQPKPKGKKRDITAEIDELFRAKPDLIGLKKFPEEVANAVQKGVDVKTAYLNYENQTLAREKEDLGARLRALLDKFQQEETKQKTGHAPSSLKGAGTSVRKPDLFMQGFSEEY